MRPSYDRNAFPSILGEAKKHGLQLKSGELLTIGEREPDDKIVAAWLAGFKISVVEAFLPNIEKIRARFPEWTFIHMDCSALLNEGVLNLDRFDFIWWYHGPEHLSKEASLRILANLRRHAKFIICSTPHGDYPQDTLYSNIHERHISRWYVRDFAPLEGIVYSETDGGNDRTSLDVFIKGKPDSPALLNSNTGRKLADAGVISVETLLDLENELTRKDEALGGYCPLNAARLRSRDAVQAYGIWLYALVRATRPEVVLETGVQNGCSTEMLLWAIHRNGRGRLFSIDSGSTSTDGSHQTAWHQTRDGLPGKDILTGLTVHWELIIGTSRDRLLPLCQRLQQIQLFWHDSDHSSANVRFEFDTVKDFIAPNGLLCMHDFNGQETTLEEPSYQLLVPNVEPLLRLWRKT